MRPIVLVVVLLLSGCATLAQSASKPRRTAASSEVAIPHEARELLARINRHRRSLGCPALAWDRRLAGVALRHSRDMARRRFFDHNNPDGLDPFERMERGGLRYRAAAENLAMGTTSGDEVFEGWMRSRGHRRNIEECIHTRAGIGLHEDYWTLVMARLTPESTP